MTDPDWDPEQLLRMSGIYWQSCALHAGVKLDVFTAIGKEHLTEVETAGKIGGDPRGVGMLLNALTAMKLLVKTGGRYGNTPFGLSRLAKNSPDYLGWIILHHHYLMESWARLDRAVKTGRPVRSRSSFSGAKRRESFLMGMYNIATKVAPLVVAAVDLKDSHHLLDLGGGPGTYAIHFCLANPRLRATVYDLPETRPFADRTIQRFGLSGRVEFQAGNYLKDRIRGTYDVVLLSQILHGEGPKDCGKIIRKAVSSLERSGRIIVHEFILNDSMDGPLHSALFSLNMLLGTPSGQSYSESQITDMLAKACVKDIRRIPIETPNHSGIIMGSAS
jgi:precorrin-6B methylase 2